jgi:Transcriptional regulators
MIDTLFDWPGSGKNCFEFRMGIEGEAAAAAACYRDSRDLHRLSVIVRKLETIDPDEDPGMDADFAFHLCVARASHNDYFVSALESLRQVIFSGMLLARTTCGLRTADKIAAINEQHRIVYDAIVRGDEQGAREGMRLHLARCRNSTRHWDLAESA